MTLSKGAMLCFRWLKTKNFGDVVSRQEVMEAAGWSAVSLKTYLGKNKLSPFLLPLDSQQLKVLMDGDDISDDYFDEVFTQKAPLKAELSVGDRLTGTSGTYTLVEPLGQGAVGQVWSANADGATRSGRVAVKVMLPREDLLADSKIVDVRRRFRKEARNGAQIDHPNVIRYLDFGETKDNPFLVMELGESSVGQVLRRSGQLTLNETVVVIRDVIAGLEHLHLHGCPHRDVKPDNMIRFGERYKVADLGIVRWTDFDRRLTTGGTITRSSMQLGSWFYMAPEQQQDAHDAVAASDVYALGIAWIEMLTGAVPAPQAVGAAAYPKPCSDLEICHLIARMVAYAPPARPTLDEVRAETVRLRF